MFIRSELMRMDMPSCRFLATSYSRTYLQPAITLHSALLGDAEVVGKNKEIIRSNVSF